MNARRKVFKEPISTPVKTVKQPRHGIDKKMIERAKNDFLSQGGKIIELEYHSGEEDFNAIRGRGIIQETVRKVYFN